MLAAKKSSFRRVIGTLLAVSTFGLLATLYFAARSIFDRYFVPHHPPGFDRLVNAIESKNPRVVKAVLDAGVNPNTYPNGESDMILEDDVTALWEAQDSSVAVVKVLLDHGADPDMGGGWGSPLSGAMMSHRFDIVAYLIKRGATLNLPARETSLWKAAVNSDISSVRKLLKTHVNANDPEVDEAESCTLVELLEGAKYPRPIIDLLRSSGAR